MSRPFSDRRDEWKEAKGPRKCPKQQVRGYSELKRREEQLQSELLAVRERLAAAEETSEQTSNALEQANNEILELRSTLGFLQQEIKAELVRQETNHLAEIDEHRSTSAAEIDHLNKTADELRASRDEYQSQLVNLGIDPVSHKPFSKPSAALQEARETMKADSKERVLQFCQSLESLISQTKTNIQALELDVHIQT